jgi:hypothetical protein
MNKYIFLILSAFFSVVLNAQTLKTTNLNLSTNGRIYDVAYIPTANAYVVVGEFTTINGASRTNFAYLNGNTLSVYPANPITSLEQLTTKSTAQTITLRLAVSLIQSMVIEGNHWHFSINRGH